MRSQTSMISAMLWSISSTPAPCSSRTERTTAAKSGHLGLRQAGRRLVEEHEPRLGRERARDAEPPLVAVRERRRRCVGVAVEPEPLEQRVRAPRRHARADADAERRDLDVLAHRERRESARCAGTCGRARAGRAGAATSA